MGREDSGKDPTPPALATARNPGYNRVMRLAGACGLGFVAAVVLSVLVARACRDYEPVPGRAFLDAPAPQVIAHRGASAVATEHTLEAFEEAIAAGADILELDVHLTADGVPVIAHDRDLERALGVPLAIAQTPLAELHHAIAAAHPDREPEALLLTLDDVLRRFDDARLNIELKDRGGELAHGVAALIEAHGAHDRVLVASFHRRALHAFRELLGDRVATSASTSEVLRFYGCYLVRIPCRPAFQALQIPPSALGLNLASRGFLEFSRRHGLAVHYWTIDDLDEIRRLFHLGADGVMTTDPEAAVRARAAARSPYP
jgi:glycerophosphoryl diester phosphodiesterase